MEEVSYEPVNIEPRFSDPKSTIDPDKPELVLRVLPILMGNKWPLIGGLFNMIFMILGVSIPALMGMLVDSIEPAIINSDPSFLSAYNFDGTFKCHQTHWWNYRILPNR